MNYLSLERNRDGGRRPPLTSSLLPTARGWRLRISKTTLKDANTYSIQTAFLWIEGTKEEAESILNLLIRKEVKNAQFNT